MKKIPVILLLLTIIFAVCKKQNEKDDDFCLYANTAYIDETIPLVNEFLAGLSEDLIAGQQLQALAEWFKSKPCIIDATVECPSCTYFSNFIISFDEDGITKEFLLYFSFNPLKAMYYRQIAIDTNWSVRLKLKLQADESYLATRDPEIRTLIAKHRVIFQLCFPGANNPELLLFYDLKGKDNKENVINDFLATGKFEDDVYEYEKVNVNN